MWISAFILCLLTGSAVADVQGGTADCYQITTAVIAGVIAGDILLTVLLLIPVYYCTRQKDTTQNKTPNRKGEGKDYMNMTGI